MFLNGFDDMEVVEEEEEELGWGREVEVEGNLRMLVKERIRRVKNIISRVVIVLRCFIGMVWD